MLIRIILEDYRTSYDLAIFVSLERCWWHHFHQQIHSPRHHRDLHFNLWWVMNSIWFFHLADHLGFYWLSFVTIWRVWSSFWRGDGHGWGKDHLFRIRLEIRMLLLFSMPSFHSWFCQWFRAAGHSERCLFHWVHPWWFSTNPYFMIFLWTLESYQDFFVFELD